MCSCLHVQLCATQRFYSVMATNGLEARSRKRRLFASEQAARLYKPSTSNESQTRERNSSTVDISLHEPLVLENRDADASGVHLTEARD